MKVVILCGGAGIRLEDSLFHIPKALVQVGHRPLVWHVMKIYAKYGYTDFVLALGQYGGQIRDYFFNYSRIVNDVTLTLGEQTLVYNTNNQEKNWKVTFVDTGKDSGTGARIFHCRKYLKKDFMVTYADCLSNVNIRNLVDHHKSSSKLVTVTGVVPPYRYGEFIFENGEPVRYQETSRLRSANGWVNGGFMVFRPGIFEYLEPFNECVLEKTVFNELVTRRQLHVFEHEGFWQCIDNDRERRYVNDLCQRNLEYWLFDQPV